ERVRARASNLPTLGEYTHKILYDRAMRSLCARRNLDNVRISSNPQSKLRPFQVFNGRLSVSTRYSEGITRRSITPALTELGDNTILELDGHTRLVFTRIPRLKTFGDSRDRPSLTKEPKE